MHGMVRVLRNFKYYVFAFCILIIGAYGAILIGIETSENITPLFAPVGRMIEGLRGVIIQLAHYVLICSFISLVWLVFSFLRDKHLFKVKRSKNRFIRLLRKLGLPDDETVKISIKREDNYAVVVIKRNIYIMFDKLVKAHDLIETVFKMPVVSIKKNGFDKIEIVLLLNDELVNETVFKSKYQAEKMLVGKSVGDYLLVDYSVYPHMLVTAPPGSGKTHFLRMVLHQIESNSLIEIFDGKGMEFSGLHDRFSVTRKNFLPKVKAIHAHMGERYDALNALSKTGEKTYKDLSLEPFFLVIDEYTTLVARLDKKDKDEFTTLVDDIVRLGRSAGMFLVIVMQRADAKYIGGETRGNIATKIVLGWPDEDSYRMMYGTSHNCIPKPTGQGYVSVGGKLVEFIFPPYFDF